MGKETYPSATETQLIFSFSFPSSSSSSLHSHTGARCSPPPSLPRGTSGCRRGLERGWHLSKSPEECVSALSAGLSPALRASPDPHGFPLALSIGVLSHESKQGFDY